ncbi:tetratricopeptide repeat domain protein [Candidatus Magnetoovum chiemensis]|nr:tetratricopeptide repeat domain protein [Candidatus Magnetoovum chiemensis]
MLTKNTGYPLPKVALILLSTAFGALFTFYIYLIRDTRNFFTIQKLNKIRKKEEKIQSHFDKGLNHLNNKRTQEAVEEFNNCLAVNPNHLLSLIKLGDIHIADVDPQSAFKYYHSAAIIDRNNTEVLFKLFEIKKNNNQYSEALDFIDRILNIEPDNLEAMNLKSQVYEKLKRWEDIIPVQKAIRDLTKDVKERKLQENILKGYEYEIAILSIEKNEIDKAEKIFKALIKEDKHFIPAIMGMSEIMLKKGATEDAVNYLKKAHEDTKAIVLLLRIEDILINIGEASKLLTIYLSALADDPENEILKFFTGKLYYRLEMLDDALNIFNSLEPSCFYPTIHKLKAGIYLKRTQYEHAVDEFLKIIDMKEALFIPYTCSNCQSKLNNWNGRCPDCQQWNTYGFNIGKLCTI